MASTVGPAGGDRRGAPSTPPLPLHLPTPPGPASILKSPHHLSSSGRKQTAFELQVSGSGSSCSAEGGSVSPPDDAGVLRRRRIAARRRTVSGSKSEDHIMLSKTGIQIFTKGRPPWFDSGGQMAKKPVVIGICGGSASGKTTVAEAIIKAMNIQWVTHLSMDSFYKVLTPDQHEQAARGEYNFDHPDAFDSELLRDTISRLKEGKAVSVPVYNFTTHSREKQQKTMYGADVIIFEGILSFYHADIRNLLDLKIFVDTDGDMRLARYLYGADVIIFEGILSFYHADIRNLLDLKIFVDTDGDMRLARYLYGADVIIFEGILSFYHADIRNLLDLKIFVDTDGDMRLARYLYGADVIIFEGILSFYHADIRNLLDLKIFVDTDGDMRLARYLYGADVIIFEGILSFYHADIRNLLDLKIFVDTDGDMRLARYLYGADVIIFEGILSFYHADIRNLLDLKIFVDTDGDMRLARYLYGADVIIFEGILSFYHADIRNLLDLKIFVDTDGDMRLARRLRRDTESRGRTLDSVLEQYRRFVKPAYDNFIAPCMKVADLHVHNGGENSVAIQLIVLNIRTELAKRGYFAGEAVGSRTALAKRNGATVEGPLPRTLKILDATPQTRGLHTFIRNKETSRDEFIFYSKRLMRLLIEAALATHLDFAPATVTCPAGLDYSGLRSAGGGHLCGVSIMRAGECMEPALREVVKDCKMGKILIQTNPATQEPELHFKRLPPEIPQYRVLLMDATVATGAAAIMAIRVLIDHDVPEENICLLSLLMAHTGAQNVAYAFPKVRIVTTAVDPALSADFHISPGLGNFGDRYYGTGMEETEEGGQDQSDTNDSDFDS